MNPSKTRPGTLDPETYTFRFSEEQGGRRLCPTSSKGYGVCYRAELSVGVETQPPLTRRRTEAKA